ncbi:MAG: DUF86 domain-containing protein [Actinomycetaceae bacterium]|nr:DUF86 domain-containing protein [Actinomycetaceae bacterium]
MSTFSDSSPQFGLGSSGQSHVDSLRDSYFVKHGFRKSQTAFDRTVALRRLGEMAEALKVAYSIVTDGENSFFAQTLAGEKTRYAAYYTIARVVEASQKLHSDVKERHPEIPWALVRQMSNKVIHLYEDIDDGIVWETLSGDFPVLESQIAAIVDELTNRQ